MAGPGQMTRKRKKKENKKRRHNLRLDGLITRAFNPFFVVFSPLSAGQPTQGRRPVSPYQQ
jgi:threonine/homoserine/homoserine lactone efflux protein